MRESVIPINASIKDALERIDLLSGQTLFVIDPDKKMVGSLSDGDIRRSLIKGNTLGDAIELIMHKEFKFIRQNEFSLEELNLFREKNINFVPVLNARCEIVDVINIQQLRSFLPLEAIIMAGGKGVRLMPLTENTPKPLLEVGGKPIIEYNIDRLIAFGIKRIYISVNYLKGQIKDYFGDGSAKGIEIKYIEETEITGTLGSATYVDDYQTKDILVMNSDLLTNINFEDVYQTYLEKNGEMIVATVPYEITIPYGVVETKESIVTSLKEKPTYTYYSNAGIYIFNSKYLKEIPQRSFYNATDLINKLISENKNVVNYPILSYWLDIGKHKDFDKAQKDVSQINFD